MIPCNWIVKYENEIQLRLSRVLCRMKESFGYIITTHPSHVWPHETTNHRPITSLNFPAPDWSLSSIITSSSSKSASQKFADIWSFYWHRGPLTCSRQPKKVNIFSRVAGLGLDLGCAGLSPRRNEISSEPQWAPRVSEWYHVRSQGPPSQHRSGLCEILSWGWQENCVTMSEDEETRGMPVTIEHKTHQLVLDSFFIMTALNIL